MSNSFGEPAPKPGDPPTFVEEGCSPGSSILAAKNDMQELVSGKPWRVSVREKLRDAMNKMMRLPLKLWARDRNPTTIAKYEQIPPMGNLSSGNEDKPRRDTKTFSRSSILHDSALLNAVGTNSEAFSHKRSSSEQEIDLAESDFDSESSERSSMSLYFRPTLESYAYTHRNSLRAAANDSHIDNLYDDLESKDNEDSDAFENSARARTKGALGDSTCPIIVLDTVCPKECMSPRASEGVL